MITPFNEENKLETEFTPEILEQLDRAGVKPGDKFVDADGVTRTRPVVPAQEINLRQNYQQLIDSGLQPGDHFRDADGKVRRVPTLEELDRGVVAFEPDEKSLRTQRILRRARQAQPEYQRPTPRPPISPISERTGRVTRQEFQFTSPEGLPRPSPVSERTGVPMERSEAVQRELRQAREASIRRALGEDEFDPSTKFAQIFTNPRDFATLTDMARSMDFESMQQKFKKRFPEGDISVLAISATPRRLGLQGEDITGFLRFTDGLPKPSPIGERTGRPPQPQPSPLGEFDTTIVARRSPDEPYRELGFAAEIAAAFVSEQAALGVLAVVASAKISGSGAMLAGLGVFVGGVLQRSIEKSRGYEQNVTVPTALTYSGFEGLLAAGGDASLRAALRAHGISSSLRSAQDAIYASERLAVYAANIGAEWEGLSRGHVAGPLGRGILDQTRGTSPYPMRKDAKIGRSLYNFFSANIDRIPPNGLGNHTLAITSRHFSSHIKSIRNVKDLDSVETGRIIQQGERLYRENMTELTNRAYKHLADVEQAAFASDGVGIIIDISRPIASAQRYRAGMQARGRPVQRETDIVDPSGRPFQTTEIPDVELPRGYHRDLEEVIDVLLELDPNMQMHTSTSSASLAVSGEGITSRAVEQAAQVRTRLFDIMQNQRNLYDNDVVRQATELWSLITDSLDNPIGNMSAEVAAAHQVARGLHGEKEQVLMQTEVFRFLSNANKAPEDIVRRYARPGRTTALRTLKEFLESSDEAARRAGNPVRESSWDTTRQGIIAEIIKDDATSAYARLNRYVSEDPTSLRLLMSESEEHAIREFLIRKANIENLNLENVFLRFSSEADRGAAILAENTPDQLRRIVNSFDGGIEGEAAGGLRKAVWRDIFSEARATHDIAGTEYLDGTKLYNRIAYWRKTEKLDAIFSEKDLLMLEDLEIFAKAFSNAADIGGPMQAGSVRAGITQGIFHAGKAIGAFQKVFANDLFAYLYSSPAIRKSYQPMSENMENRFRQMTLYLTLLSQAEFSPPTSVRIDPTLEGQQ